MRNQNEQINQNVGLIESDFRGTSKSAPYLMHQIRNLRITDKRSLTTDYQHIPALKPFVREIIIIIIIKNYYY